MHEHVRSCTLECVYWCMRACVYVKAHVCSVYVYICACAYFCICARLCRHMCKRTYVTPHGKMRYRGARNFRVFCLLPQLPRFSPFWKTRSRFSLCLKLRLQFLPFLLQISHYLSFFYSQISFLVKFQSNTRFITMKICNNNVLW